MGVAASGDAAVAHKVRSYEKPGSEYSFPKTVL